MHLCHTLKGPVVHTLSSLMFKDMFIQGCSYPNRRFLEGQVGGSDDRGMMRCIMCVCVCWKCTVQLIISSPQNIKEYRCREYVVFSTLILLTSRETSFIPLRVCVSSILTLFTPQMFRTEFHAGLKTEKTPKPLSGERSTSAVHLTEAVCDLLFKCSACCPLCQSFSSCVYFNKKCLNKKILN